jgi:hypothetical protein
MNSLFCSSENHQFARPTNSCLKLPQLVGVPTLALVLLLALTPHQGAPNSSGQAPPFASGGGSGRRRPPKEAVAPSSLVRCVQLLGFPAGGACEPVSQESWHGDPLPPPWLSWVCPSQLLCSGVAGRSERSRCAVPDLCRSRQCGALRLVSLACGLGVASRWPAWCWAVAGSRFSSRILVPVGDHLKKTIELFFG